MNINEINEYINQYVFENDTQQITPTRLNAVLKTMTSGLDEIKLNKPTQTLSLANNDKLIMWQESTSQPYLMSPHDIPEVDLSNFYNKPEIDTKFSAIPVQEFVKNGLGWSTKYKVDNPGKYVSTGENAIDLTKAYANSAINFGASGKDSFAVGAYNLASGANSISIGYNTKAYGSIGFSIGYQNTAYSSFSGVIGGSSNVIGTESEITTPVSGLNNRAFIFGGSTNKIINGNYSTIVGGLSNTINTTSKSYNSIFGGLSNVIQTNSQYSTIIGGSNNITSGNSQFVTGNSNQAITIGETIIGNYATIQNTTLPGDEFNDNYRIFGVGNGVVFDDSDIISRLDAFNIYQSGLIVAPSLSLDLIKNNPKALVTSEYLSDYQILKSHDGGYVIKNKLINDSEFNRIGNNSIDLSFGEDYHITKGANSFSVGLNNQAIYDNTILLTYNGISRGKNTTLVGGNLNTVGMTSNVSAGEYTVIVGGNNNKLETGHNSTIIGGENNVSGHPMMASTDRLWDKNNSILGGNTNKVIQTANSSIIGGGNNSIGFTAGPQTIRNGYLYASHNVIVGGNNNKIVPRNEAFNTVYSSVVLGGENNVANGYYNIVSGIGNEAVSWGETLFGSYATVKNYNNNKPYNDPAGWQRLEDARIFGIGIGTDSDNRKDAINVYNNGLITAPALTAELINNNSKALITSDYLTPQLLIKILTSATEEEKTQIKTLLNL